SECAELVGIDVADHANVAGAETAILQQYIALGGRSQTGQPYVFTTHPGYELLQRAPALLGAVGERLVGSKSGKSGRRLVSQHARDDPAAVGASGSAMGSNHRETAAVDVIELHLHDPEPRPLRQPDYLFQAVVLEVLVADGVVGVPCQHQGHVALLEDPDSLLGVENAGNLPCKVDRTLKVVEHRKGGHHFCFAPGEGSGQQ